MLDAPPGAWAYAPGAEVLTPHQRTIPVTAQAPTGLEKHVYHPYMDEGPWTSEVRVGDVPLQVGQMMDYNFDFGDNWHFNVVLERIDPPDPALTEPTILESHGEPPDQYPVYDEGEGWD